MCLSFLPCRHRLPDRTITWSATVPPRNEVVAGRWWPQGYKGPPLVSIEDRAADALGLKVGDEITVAVLGVDVTARIAALRRIDWGGLGLAGLIGLAGLAGRNAANNRR